MKPNWKTWVPLSLAATLGLAAAKVAYDLTKLPPTQVVGPAVDLTPVAVASRAILPGQKIADADVRVMNVERATSPVGAVGEPSGVVGRVSRQPLAAGQPITEAVLAAPGSAAGLQAVLPPGMRAVTVEVDEYRGVAGYLVPGCRVDVVTTVRGENDDQTLAATVVQNLEVLAIGRARESVSEGPNADSQAPDPGRSVTLRATPEQAAAIELAARTGMPRLVLRSGTDSDESNVPGVTIAQLRTPGHAQAHQAVAAAPRKPGGGVLPAVFSMFGGSKAIDAVAHATPEPLDHTIRMIRRGVETDVTLPLQARGPAITSGTPAVPKVQPAVPPTPDPTMPPTMITDVPTRFVFPND